MDCDERPPVAAMAQRIPEVATGDVHWEARGRCPRRRLLALRDWRTKTTAAISAMAIRDEIIRNRIKAAVREICQTAGK